jgi:hypoxanthine phosphoribosyltransferase
MTRTTLHVLYSRDDIAERVRSLAERVSHDYRGGSVVLVGVLKGAFVFLADLMRSLSIPVEVDFVRLASYGDAMESAGSVVLSKDIELSIEGRDVLVVEDIVDSGRTLKQLLVHLQGKKPRSLKSCCLLDKRHRREVELDMDYVGFVMDDGFVVGYGLDWAEAFRYLPELCIVEAAEASPAGTDG